MTFSKTEVQLILACLRYTAMAYEEIAKMSLQKGDRRAAMQQGGFARRAGELSDRLAKEAAPAHSIIRPN